ncbi:Flp pilus assembly protein RcpC/CpaB [Neomoorella glycerini]|uniref:Flp pilus assembly protein RcpC/CpaB n=1 Tax=Neomoorella glycerini TaxID=55779 RepID=A0A6I5ZVC2_9FIRM|nr:Flp pilus assembly protein CpaB [Moorella glycerini]QGP93814.1 Flp pilus assembly protein RcpC/CpaB [Moorella glycerini]
MRNKLLLVLSLVTALVAAVLVYYYLDNLKKTYQQKGDFIQVVVARVRIPARTPITTQMIEVKELPAQYISAKAITEPKEALGKTVKSEILPGEILRLEKLASGKDAADGLAFLISPGKRAITVAVNDVSGLAGLLRPGDRVDVLGTFDLPAAAGQEKAGLTSLLVQNVEVLSVDQTLAAPGQPVADGKKQIGYRNVTLMVTPEQAQPIVLCSEKGSIRLLLRAPADQDIITLPSIKIPQLVR